MLWLMTVGLLGCNGGDKLLKELDGAWIGAASVDVETYDVNATFSFSDYLAGEVIVAEPGGTRIYAVRRAEAYSGFIALDLLESTGGTRALDLDGEFDDAGAFAGTITLTFDCEGEICGYTGDYTLTRTDAPVGGGSGTTPVPPGGSAPVVSGGTGAR